MTALSFAVYAIGCVAIVVGLELWTRHDLRKRELRDREMARKPVIWPSGSVVELAAPDEPTRPVTPVRKDGAP